MAGVMTRPMRAALFAARLVLVLLILAAAYIVALPATANAEALAARHWDGAANAIGVTAVVALLGMGASR